jgi:glyceraldehyde 3-phosphate dehydrogenase
MAVRIGIMGFGRLGRNMFRIAHDQPDIEFRAVSDLADADSLAYLLQYSTIEGPFAAEVRREGPYLVAGQQRMRVLHGTRPGEVPWDVLGCDIVVESTGRFRRRVDLEKHLEAGAGKVILSTPPQDDIDRLVILGVNERDLRPSDRLVSAGSSSVHALALLLKVLHEGAGISRAVMTTVHAYTSDQQLSDTAKPGLRWSRSAAQNIIPNTSWAPRAVQDLLPDLRGKITGMALNVPVPAGSVIDLNAELKKPLSAAEVNAIVREAAEGPYKGRLAYTEEPIVSSDVVGNPASGVFDAQATMSLGNGMVKCVIWYDNGWGFAYRMVELARLMAGQAAPKEVAR